MWHPLFIAQTLGMTAIIFILRPYDPFMPEDVIIRKLIIASCVIVFLTVLVLLFKQSPRWPIFGRTFPVLVIGVLVASVWGVGISSLVGGQFLGPWEWLQLLAFNTIFTTLGEIFLASFLLKSIVRDTGLTALPIAAVAPPTQEPPNPVKRPQWREVLGNRLMVDDIWHLKAEEHYVAIHLRDGQSLLARGRLVDAIAQLPDTCGMQVHRSHWVAKSALAALHRQRSGLRLELHNGHIIPVARNRQADVRPWASTTLQTA
ncbi:LytTR family DNA-binding domain-containing protein [Pseudorhodobacter aquimaris]|uniref:LytTR family DNA-binding domain-containing protein n=1 Tax=Pseudorhodobacter aquimaris TaxID=687412 RepID=UPI0018DE9BCA|nr:LytTR family DNA-binding domain-containing protein [Pseudorhodobacter aquimaris]